ncbi:MAG: hypothetical protein K9H49_08075 [Bacteroidales bacterium]|nr:hypothetical protein [Bacteroidales bacterium]MCF8391367.1 hypothetical protein [Bacteroidales bacterium]
MKSLFLFSALILIQFQLFSQNNLFETERKLKVLFDSIYKLPDTSERELLNNEVLTLFKEGLMQPEAIYFKWNKLNMIGKVYSEDEKLMIYTWHLQQKNGKYKYYGFIQYKPGKSKKGQHNIIVHTLTDRSDEMKNPALLELTEENWFGSLYFGIKTFENRRNSLYALFGYDFHDNYSQKKLIEILEFDKNGNAIFSGKFDMDFQEFKRIIFEYSDNIAMTLRYDERLDRIIYDHLAPFEPIFTGSYRFYGPDGSYDGLKFNKSVFHLEKDVDARND